MPRGGGLNRAATAQILIRGGNAPHRRGVMVVGQTIALVDDARNILTSVSMMLEAEGFHVRTFTDGDAAYRGLSARPADLAILDQHALGVIVAVAGLPDRPRIDQEAAVDLFDEGHVAMAKEDAICCADATSFFELRRLGMWPEGAAQRILRRGVDEVIGEPVDRDGE